MYRKIGGQLEDLPANLPETLTELGISEEDHKEFNIIYSYWVALDRRYPPDVLLKQSDRILSYFIARENLTARFEKIKSNKETGTI